MKIKDLSEKTVNELSPETRKSYLLKAAPLNRANPTAKRSKGINRALFGPSKTDDQNVNETHDQSTEARELFLFAENDSDLYRTSFLPIVKNLEKKFKKGTYDKALAAKLWKYHADRAAKKYGIEHGSVDGFKIFSPSVRREVAEKFATDHFIEMDAGNFHDNVAENEKNIMEDSDAVIGAITQRIVLSHPELLRHGPEAVMDAINDVAHSVGQVDEIGTSDVSGWVKQVAEILSTGTPNLSESKKTNKKKIK